MAPDLDEVPEVAAINEKVDVLRMVILRHGKHLSKNSLIALRADLKSATRKALVLMRKYEALGYVAYR